MGEQSVNPIAKISLFLYNTMMSYKHILHSLALALLVMPTGALAYMTPEEVLTSDENARFFDPPPNQRNTRAIADAQASSAAARRAAEQEALFGNSSSAAADEELHGAAPDESDDELLQQLLDQLSEQGAADDTSALSAADQRILDRVRDRQLELQIEQQAQVLASQQSLHGGAPLSDTGMGTTIAIATLAGAGFWTLWRARKMEKQS